MVFLFLLLIAPLLSVPKHNIRAFICDGPYEWTSDSGVGNQAWPTFSCPADSNAGHRSAIMDASLKYVGIGVWGKGGNLINAAPQAQTQDFTAADQEPVYYPNVRIFSASHVFIGTGQGDNMQTMQFWANYFGTSVPTLAEVWVAGTRIPLTCKAGWGPSGSNCVYTSDVIPTTGGCRLYFFSFSDAAGATRYPEEGAFFTYGEGSCRDNWIPKSVADPLIAAGGSATLPPTTTIAGGGVTTTTAPTTLAPATSAFPPSTKAAAVATSGPAGGAITSPPVAVLLFNGAPGCRLRIRYLARFADYVQNAQFGPLMSTLRNTTAALLGVNTDVFAAERALAGSIIVDWFLVDGFGAPGSAATTVDAFLSRFASGSDLAIGNHFPPIADAAIVDRAASLGALLDSPTNLGLFIGAAVGGVIFIAAVIVLVILLVKYFRSRKSSSGSSYSGAAAQRYEAVHSRIGGDNLYAPKNALKQEPLMGNEPLLYLARNSRAAVERQGAHFAARYPSAAASGQQEQQQSVIPARVRAVIIQDFEGETVAPNCLAVRKGDLVWVEDSSSPDWWDVRNANHELGFVPASFCQLMQDRPVPQPQPKAAEVVRFAAAANPTPVQQPHDASQQARPAMKAVPIPPAKKKVSPAAPVVVAVPQPLKQAVKQPQKKSEYAIVLADYDASTTRDGLSVRRDERVEIMERSNADWWDVRNAAKQIGYVPASFLREVGGAVPPPVAVAAPLAKKKATPAPVIVEDFDNDVTVHELEMEMDDMTMEVPLIQTADLVAIESKKAFAAPRKPAPTPPAAKLAAPIPGTPFRAEFDYEAMGESEVAAKAGDLLIAPVGADLSGEWLFVLNRRTQKKGFMPMSFLSQQ